MVVVLRSKFEVKHNNATVIIGAGPYGLSVAAHLRSKNQPVYVFGKPMEFWQKMPEKLYLKSFWSAASLSAPHGKYSLNHYASATGTQELTPIPLTYFLDYCRWFQKHNVPEIDSTFVQSL